MLAVQTKKVSALNQSINQVSRVPISSGEARLSGVTAESVFKSKIEETVP